MPEPVLTLYQAEWCPYSSRVRQRLTELGLPWLAVPVPADPAERRELVAATGTDVIPAVVLDDGAVLAGDTGEILAELGRRFPEPAGAAAHRRQAAAHGVAGSA